MSDEAIFIGGGGANYATAQQLLLKYANRNGLIAGATGTGKTVTLQIMAEAFSAQGVPVFLSDVKGYLSGLAEAEAAREFTAARRYTAGGSAKRKAPSRGDSVGTAFAKSFARQMGTRAGRAVMRGVLGALTGR